MFFSARWRLTLWFALVMAVTLAVLGTIVYLTARHLILTRVDDELRTRAETEAPFILSRLARGARIEELELGEETEEISGFYAILGPEGRPLVSTIRIPPSALPSSEEVFEVLAKGPRLFTFHLEEGEHYVRVYVAPLESTWNRTLLLAVGRSIEPELSSLRSLLMVLAGGGAGALALSTVGGYILAGRALRPIRQAMDRQRTFIADASHELRTPLAIVKANAELLRRHPEDPISSHLQEVDDIIGETGRLAHLVSQLLTLARADAGRLPLQKEWVDLTALAQEAVRQMAPRAQEKGLTLEGPSSGPIFVLGDSVRIKEVALILLDNAIKFNKPEGKVWVRTWADGSRAYLEVSDTGIGIEPQDLPRVFERFYRGQRAGATEDGAGLGLSIAKAIVEAHGGQITAQSRPKEGSTFRVVFPKEQGVLRR